MPHLPPPYSPTHGHDDSIVGSDDGPELMIKDGWQWQKETDLLGQTKWVPLKEVNEDGSSGGSSSSFSGVYVNDALTAASQAISAFLTGQSLSDARKLSAAEQFQKQAAFALPAGTLPPGFGEGEAMHQLAARKGRAYTPPPMQSRQVNPAGLEQAGQVPPEIMSFIDQMLDAGANGGRVVQTGGSQSG